MKQDFPMILVSVENVTVSLLDWHERIYVSVFIHNYHWLDKNGVITFMLINLREVNQGSFCIPGTQSPAVC